jgi:thiol-disulfide isomerase/thioredoxin
MEESKSVITGDSPIFIKFYKSGCPSCEMMAPQFKLASTYFENIPFVSANCFNVAELCQEYDVVSYPLIGLIRPASKIRIPFNGDQSVDGFAYFVERETSTKVTRPSRIVAELNPFSYSPFLAEHNCSAVLFYTPGCRHCQRFLSEFHITSRAFIFEKRAALAVFNCGQFNDFCQSIPVIGWPQLRLFGAESVEYSGDRTSDKVREFVNEKCGCARRADGLLMDTVGLVNNSRVREIAEVFRKGKGSAKHVQEMKSIPGTELYLMVMQRIIEKGQKVIGEDVRKLRKFLDERKGSPAAIDGVKMRLNVFQLFAPEQDPKSQDL